MSLCVCVLPPRARGCRIEVIEMRQRLVVCSSQVTNVTTGQLAVDGTATVLVPKSA